MSEKYTIQDFLTTVNAYAPVITYDNKHIVYASSITDTLQLYMMPVVGRETKQLTDYIDGIDSISASPFDNTIIFGKSIGGDEYTQLFQMDLDTLEITSLTDHVKAKFIFGGFAHNSKKITYSSNERNGSDFDVYIYDLVTGKAKCIFEAGDWSESAGFSNDDRYIGLHK